MTDKEKFLMNQAPQEEEAKQITPMTGRDSYEVFSQNVNQGGDNDSNQDDVEIANAQDNDENEDKDVSMYRENDPIESIFETYKRNFEEEKRQNMAGQLTEAQEEAGNDDSDDEEEDNALKTQGIKNVIIGLAVLKDFVELLPFTAPLGLIMSVCIFVLLVYRGKHLMELSLLLLAISLIELMPFIQILPISTFGLRAILNLADTWEKMEKQTKK